MKEKLNFIFFKILTYCIIIHFFYKHAFILKCDFSEKIFYDLEYLYVTFILLLAYFFGKIAQYGFNKLLKKAHHTKESSLIGFIMMLLGYFYQNISVLSLWQRFYVFFLSFCLGMILIGDEYVYYWIRRNIYKDSTEDK